jgi:hypothetical protein
MTTRSGSSTKQAVPRPTRCSISYSATMDMATQPWKLPTYLLVNMAAHAQTAYADTMTTRSGSSIKRGMPCSDNRCFLIQCQHPASPLQCRSRPKPNRSGHYKIIQAPTRSGTSPPTIPSHAPHTPLSPHLHEAAGHVPRLCRLHRCVHQALAPRHGVEEELAGGEAAVEAVGHKALAWGEGGWVGWWWGGGGEGRRISDGARQNRH